MMLPGYTSENSLTVMNVLANIKKEEAIAEASSIRLAAFACCDVTERFLPRLISCHKSAF